MKLQSQIFGIFIVFFILTVASSCYYDVEEEIYGQTSCDTTGVAFQATILPLIQNNCLACHDAANNFGSVTLETHAQIKNQVDNGKLIGTITHAGGFSPMPQGAPKLLDCEIAKIEKWIADGAPNN